MSEIHFRRAVKPLFQPNRYKVLFGGRGSGKSWDVARALLILGTTKPLRIMCGRELQNSIQESVHRLLCDQIDKLGLSQFYEYTQKTIRGANGTEFFFIGFRHNIQSVKSMEGIDICWIEEAQTLSETSFNILIPTIRKQGSEIWFTMNPELETDIVYDRLITNTPSNCTLINLNYVDNPKCPDTLVEEAEECKRRSMSDYLHIWMGQCKQFLEGAYYAEYLARAEEEGRVAVVPHEPILPVNTAWDLGIGDDTAIVFFQVSPAGQVRVLDYYECRGVGLEHYAKVLQDKYQQNNWLTGYHLLPHDVEVRELGSGQSRYELLMAFGIRPTIVPRLSVEDGIQAVRNAFPKLYINKPKCEHLIQSLRRYRREYDEKRRVFYDKPRHDEHSHCADAVRYMCVGMSLNKTSRPIKRKVNLLV